MHIYSTGFSISAWHSTTFVAYTSSYTHTCGTLEGVPSANRTFTSTFVHRVTLFFIPTASIQNKI